MISVIIPAYNEEKTIKNTIAFVNAHTVYKRMLQEIIVVDGGSTDNTAAEAAACGARVIYCESKKRVTQLNLGATEARGKIFYFLNAHSLPPSNFITEIIKAEMNGHACGTFSVTFDKRHWMLDFISWCTRPERSWFQLSDQSLFITKELFDKSGGFREDHWVMANQEMIQRLKRYTNFIVVKDSILISTGRYLRDGILRTGLVQATVFILHKLGYAQKSMTALYRKFLRWEIGPKAEQKRKEINKLETLKEPKVRVVSLRH
jgi:glycosyltransferase involved in cell wall biosynthesis